MPRPGLREIPGSLLVGSSRASVRGLCNRTGKPVEGTVLVTETLGPDLYDAIVVSSAVICARGGRTGHMQSLCRSRGIPVLRVDAFEPDAFVGEVTIRVDRESVVLGGVDAEPQRARPPGVGLDELESICVVVSDATDIRSTNDIAPPAEQVNCFFVREEFVCFAAGLSPVDALRAGDREAERYGEAVASELCTMVKELLPRQRLVMRLLDLRSDDAARITTGAAVPAEPNPELGLHGARWLLAEGRYPRAFRALRAYLRDRLGWDAERVGFAVPFINDEDEFLRLRRHLGLPGDTPLGVFLETPAAVHSTAGFSRAGASELFVGTKDLIQFYLAADRGNHLVASSYETRHPAVLAALRQAVESCRETGVTLHVFVLGADVDHYLRQVPTRTLMMCTAELAQLASRRAGPAAADSA
ncbi:putative PEP-binding protein [Amycolatopsis sp., V23-08]|uniref:PEP-binding protein n=1 Tax=Amycolatopsis heterodermiae TaxID=3110235 RepID=A0ABU5R8D5_9PSEU|nr:putative PEP-binding protein [Amycolatopsis sp., V23-08]MEA5362498.1 putative PEP-binding protein [Amycolatopsis sp., V23-08]